MQNRLSRWFYVLGGLFVCLCLAGVAFLYLDYTTAMAMPTIPIVSITETYPKNPVVADQSVVIFGQANDPDGIVEVQLWVNGQMIASQTNPEQASKQPFDVSQTFIPNGAANYLVLLRAIDGRGSAGQSDPVMVEAAERTYTYEVAAGDTVEKIAEMAGTTPEDISQRNPGIGNAPVPGTPIDVPAVPAVDGAVPTGDGADEPPHVDPPVEVTPPTGDETPADPASPPFWTYLPLPDNFICLFNPVFCTTPLVDETLSVPINVGAVLRDSCQVMVVWEDTSENELGFHIYRGHTTPDQLIGSVVASPGSSARSGFMDVNLPNGEYFYFVSVYDSSGEYFSIPSEKITVSCRLPGTTAGWSLAIEALEMTVRDPYDRLYCYASLAGAPFERIPHGSSFIEMESGSWNIAEHFGGVNRRVIFSERDPIWIVVEGMGWQGDTLINLGQFARSHPHEEWDGRHLTAGPPDGSFSVTYRIQLFTGTATEEEVGRSVWALDPIIDPSIPPPYDLHTTDFYVRCRFDGCMDVNEPGFGWSYLLDPPPMYFKVYGRWANEDTPHHYYTLPDSYPAPQSGFINCDQSAFYSVSSVVGYTDTGEEIESPLSEELEVPPSCPQLEITLIGLDARSTKDGDPGTDFCLSDCGNTVEAYGWLKFNGHSVTWNDHCDPGSGRGCLTSGPPYTSVNEDIGSSNFWIPEYLSTGRRFRIPILIDRPLTVTFGFSDHDFMSPDDFWCGWSSTRSYNAVLPAHSPEEWMAIDQEVWVESPNHNCAVGFHVRGVP
ncbi:MAG: LysM peptidoglycan-binding domain-containing protein [Anaerolineales bacterium]|nr:LysM peptidoglycan-binding domain-containing protein [Anaerolineales bacterium]